MAAVEFVNSTNTFRGERVAQKSPTRRPRRPRFRVRCPASGAHLRAKAEPATNGGMESAGRTPRLIRAALLRRQRVFAALDLAAVILHFKDGVDDFTLPDVVKRSMKEFPLLQRCHVGNDDDETRMDWSAAVKREEVQPVVGHKRVVALQDRIHQLPVFRTSKREVGHMVSRMTGGMGQLDQGSMQALVNEEFCHAQATARRCRVMRTGFFFAQGRCAGRPRRGNAAT